jgi:hypothetical protein
MQTPSPGAEPNNRCNHPSVPRCLLSTVSTTGAAPDLDSDVWMKLFGESRFQYVQDDDELDEYEESDPIDTKRQMRVSRQ